jgi:hypothetical protein
MSMAYDHSIGTVTEHCTLPYTEHLHPKYNKLGTVYNFNNVYNNTWTSMTPSLRPSQAFWHHFAATLSITLFGQKSNLIKVTTMN